MSVTKLCPKCNNIMNPKENREQSCLMWHCRICDRQYKADNNIVYYKEHTEWQNTVSQHTMPRTKNVCCKKCNHHEAAFCQVQPAGEENVSLRFQCTNARCGHRWLVRPTAHQLEGLGC